MRENKIIMCGISENMMWKKFGGKQPISTSNFTAKARDFAASEWDAARLGIEQCWEMRVVFCGGETGQDEAEAGGRTARQTGNNIFATIRAHRYR